MRQTPNRPASKVHASRVPAIFASLLVTGVLALSACKSGGPGEAGADAL